ncbi:MAG: NTP transferase domain-containing protein [Planctomycetes bacterium]|nr:NTP transferase domain-containing protein [Planctomycetota bacterium]
MSDAAFYSVIMAGGASSRFWPFDGDANPKFLLKPDGEKSLLRHAYERAAALSERENILVVTGLKQAEIIRNELPEVERANLLIEPSRRDTLAAAGWAMAEISRRDENAMALLTPADSFFEPQQEFAKAIQAASKENSFEAGRLYAIGVKPTRAETGFGYIEIESHNPALVQAALRFVEKPDAERAAEYVQSGRFLWNVGSFVWRVEDFLAEVK